MHSALGFVALAAFASLSLVTAVPICYPDEAPQPTAEYNEYATLI